MNSSDILTIVFVGFCILVILADHFNVLMKLSEYCAKDSKSVLNDYEKTNLD